MVFDLEIDNKTFDKLCVFAKSNLISIEEIAALLILKQLDQKHKDVFKTPVFLYDVNENLKLDIFNNTGLLKEYNEELLRSIALASKAFERYVKRVQSIGATLFSLYAIENKTNPKKGV